MVQTGIDASRVRTRLTLMIFHVYYTANNDDNNKNHLTLSQFEILSRVTQKTANLDRRAPKIW